MSFTFIAEVQLYIQRSPYTTSTVTEFDPNLGKHDAFLIVDRYIFAQVCNSIFPFSIFDVHFTVHISILLFIYPFYCSYIHFIVHISILLFIDPFLNSYIFNYYL